ncbi:MAG: SagB family peptide dehydrogenase [Pseudonocardia sp.]|nr:SagB family peptide dehydrogenase [Pseudonocardia sp.]
MTLDIPLVPGEAIRRFRDAAAKPNDHPIDWRAAPATYKRYPVAGRVVLSWASPRSSRLADPTLETAGALLRDLLGLRTSWSHHISEIGLLAGAQPGLKVGRPAPSGGALYPIEAYLAIGPGPERPAGLYHYDAAHHCLDLLRAGEHRAALCDLLAVPPAAMPELVLVLAAAFWRNGFKYGEFAYRLHCQETGCLTAQALALADALNLTVTAHVNFADHELYALLGLDPTREGPLAILTLTGAGGSPVADSPSRADLIGTPASQPSNPAADVTESLPCLLALHSAATEYPADGSAPGIPPLPAGPVVRLPPAHPVRLADGIPARASAPAGYQPTPVDPETLHTVLAHAIASYPGDLSGAADAPVSLASYVLVCRVTGVAPGAYCYQANTGALIRVADVDAVAAIARGPLQPATRAALHEAAAVLIPVGDPFAGVPSFGDRWYRIQHIETGLVLHRATLVATALGLATRIHSEATNPVTDAALGFQATPLGSLSFLLIGSYRPGPAAHYQTILENRWCANGDKKSED